jgi:hypothetical protein
VRIKDASTLTIPGWLGGTFEGVEAGAWDTRKQGLVDRARNFVPVEGAKLGVRGGSAVQLTLAAGDVANVLGLWPFSPTGAIAIAFDPVADTHYAYALTDTLEFALPVGTPTEAGSRVELGSEWETPTAGRPNAVELFEKLYVFDASETGRRAMVSLKVQGGALVATTPVYNLDGVGGNDAAMRPFCGAAFSSVLFAFGWDSEAEGIAPHLARHSFLGVDPVEAAGFDPDAYAILGAHGQPVRAAVPGNTILLVAKESELYRITGTGRGFPGWQFAFQSLANSQGRGCATADALCHADGIWYGVGRAGPFATDGVEVFDLLPPRLRSWPSVDTLDVAWVRPHPERKAILFGFHIAGEPSRPAYPFEIWVYDRARNQWSGSDWRFPRTFHVVAAIASGVSAGPSNVPDDLEQVFDAGQFAFEQVWGTFSAGDVQASTEVWAREPDGVSQIVAVLPKGVQRFSFDANASKRVFVKLRHVKGGAIGEFTGELAFYTRVLAPLVTAGPPFNDGPVRADYFNYNDLADILTSDSGGFENEYPDQPPGVNVEQDLPNDACIVTDPPDQGAIYAAQARRNDWPVGFDLSASVECHTLGHKCAGGIELLAPEPRQRLERGGMQEDSIFVTFFPSRTGQRLTVQYRVQGETEWLDGPFVITTPAAGLGYTELLLTGLAHSTIYEVRLNCEVQSIEGGFIAGFPSAAVAMFTTLKPPTLVAEAIGTGTPTVRLTVTQFVDGHDLFLYNALATYEALYPAIAAGTDTYESLVGVCGTGDRYFARHRSTDWPEGWQFSDAAFDDVADPCVTA